MGLTVLSLFLLTNGAGLSEDLQSSILRLRSRGLLFLRLKNPGPLNLFGFWPEAAKVINPACYLQGCGVKQALWLYLLLPPIGWLVVAGWAQGPERFGLQWQAFGFGIICSSLLIFLDSKSFASYCQWLQRRMVWPLLVLGLIWLVSMGFVHGFLGAQMEGLLSGALFLMLVPMSCFAWTRVGNDCRAGFGIIVSLILLIENIMLTIHLLKGLDLSGEVIGVGGFFRVFLNTRDGNTIAIAAAIFAYYVLGSRRCRWLGFILFSSVFFNGWITAGRGLFICVCFGLLVSLISSSGELAVGKKSIEMFSWCLVAVGFSWMLYSGMKFLVGSDAVAFHSMLDRSVKDFSAASSSVPVYGRMAIWRGWISEGLQHSCLFGSGLGVRPTGLNITVRVYTPHNIFVQLVSEGGLFSLAMVLLSVVLLFNAVSVGKILGNKLAVYGLSSMLLWLGVSSVLYWPAGVWIISNCGAMFCGDNCIEIPERTMSKGLRVLFPLCIVALVVLLLSKKAYHWSW